MTVYLRRVHIGRMPSTPARVLVPTPALRCTAPTHDHTTPEDGDGGLLPNNTTRPMTCNDCATPTHYDDAIDAYVHDDPAAAPCLLVQCRPVDATPCVFA